MSQISDEFWQNFDEISQNILLWSKYDWHGARKPSAEKPWAPVLARAGHFVPFHLDEQFCKNVDKISQNVARLCQKASPESSLADGADLALSDGVDCRRVYLAEQQPWRFQFSEHILYVRTRLKSDSKHGASWRLKQYEKLVVEKAMLAT